MCEIKTHRPSAPRQLRASLQIGNPANTRDQSAAQAAIKVNGHRLIDCLDAKPKVTPSCDCGAL
jgi:hypothetical protein